MTRNSPELPLSTYYWECLLHCSYFQLPWTLNLLLPAVLTLLLWFCWLMRALYGINCGLTFDYLCRGCLTTEFDYILSYLHLKNFYYHLPLIPHHFSSSFSPYADVHLSLTLSHRELWLCLWLTVRLMRCSLLFVDHSCYAVVLCLYQSSKY